MKNLILKNGQTAKYLHKDDWNRPVYQLENGRKVCCTNLNGTYLHSMNRAGEPESPLSDDFQPV